MVALRGRLAPKQKPFAYLSLFDAQHDQAEYERECRHDQKCEVTEGEGQELFHGPQPQGIVVSWLRKQSRILFRKGCGFLHYWLDIFG